MKISLAQTLLFNEPLMLSQGKLDTILHALSGRENLSFESDQGMMSGHEGTHKLSQGNAIAIIPIHGTITHRPVGLSALSGLTSYERIESMLDEALDNPKVSEIVLDINSHGGAVSGAFDLADKIYESRSIKKITAIVNEAAHSAAFLMASSAETIIAPRTANVGSIGVITAHVDNSVRNQQEGRKVTYITAGKYKAAGNPDEPLSEEALTNIQSKVNESYDLFVSTVARNRGISVEAVSETEAQTYSSSKAKEIGLVDSIMSVNAAFDSIIERNKEQEKPKAKRISRRARAISINP